MLIVEHTVNECKIAEVYADEIIVKNLQDALELIANISYQRMSKIIIKEKNITKDFFKLRNGLAGEILQKCANYGINIAIVGDFSKIESKSLKSFISECNRGNQFYFASSASEAKEMLARLDPI